MHDKYLFSQLWDKGHTPIKVDILDKYLKDYTNKQDAELLLIGFKEGFRLQYTGPRFSNFCQNLLSVEGHREETKHNC